MRVGWKETDGTRREGDLFEIFAALSRDTIATFPALRPHQRMPWHAFCVQAAALALHRAGRTDPPKEAAAWRDLLIGLTPDWPGGEAWELVVEDWSMPALLQPPVAGAEQEKAYAKARSDAKKVRRSPGALDATDTAKNHDVKTAGGAHSGEEWLFALVTVQTASSYGGKGHNAVVRARSGYKTRPFLTAQVSPRPGLQFTRDVDILLRDRQEVLDRTGMRDDGHALLWLQAWDGSSQCIASELQPYFIEAPRRVRIEHGPDGGLQALVPGATKPRIVAPFVRLKGKTSDDRVRLDDPWAPADRDTGVLYGPKQETGTYRDVAAQLRMTRPALANLYGNDPQEGLALIVSGMGRGENNVSTGLRERRIPVSRRARGLLGTLGGKMLDRAGGVAEERAAEAGRMANYLWLALFVLHRSETEDDLTRGEAATQRGRLASDHKATSGKIVRWIGLYDQKVDTGFFDKAFWDEVSEEQDGAASVQLRRNWRKHLRDVARGVLDAAAREAPGNQARRFKAQARARIVFDARTKIFVKDD